MSNCISCGRELPSLHEPHNICPECRAAVMQRAEASAPRRTQGSVARGRMPLTTAIIAINILVFAAMVLTGVSPFRPGNEALVHWGANNGLVTLLNQPWRMLTSNYVHIGLLHITLNMWCLWNLGLLAEQIFDRWTYLLAYLFCGIAGSLVSLVVHPIGVSAGASGAVFGMAGLLISVLYLGHLPIHPGAMKATLKSLLSFAGYNLFFGAVVPAIDNSAHVGGLVTGLALGAALAPHLTSPREERQSWNRWIFLAAACVFVASYYMARHFVPQLVFQR